MEILQSSTKTFIATVRREVKQDNSVQEVLEKYTRGNLKLMDHAIVSVKAAGGSQLINFFKTEDRKEVGIINIDGAKLEKDEYFVPVAVQLLAASVADQTVKNDLLSADYKTIGLHPVLKNAEIDFKPSAASYLMKEMPLEQFDTTGDTSRKAGLYYFDAPALIKPQTQITLEIRSNMSIPANTVVKAIIYGIKTVTAK